MLCLNINFCQSLHTLHTYTTQPTLHTEQTKELAKVPRHGFLAQRFKMARSEPLIQEADPHITKLANISSDVGKDGPKKI